MAASNTPFHPNYLVVLSELSTKEKEFYYNLLIQNECKFHTSHSNHTNAADQGQYVVNLRLLAPGVKKVEVSKKKKTGQINQSNSFPFEERLLLLQDHENTNEGGLTTSILQVNLSGVEEFDYNSYPRFSLLISNDGDTVTPRLKLLSWLMRYIEDLYDTRFTYEAAEVGREEFANGNTIEKVSSIFPVFVVKRLSMKLGLRTIVEQTCWDLLYNAHTYRRDYLEVEMFCRFLQEFYDHDDLLFFLYVRSVVAKQLHVSFKTRWGKSDGPGRQPKSLWLSYRECVAVARAVFGESNESMCRDFLAIVTPQMVGQKSEPQPNKIGSGTDTRRIDITQFLHLAVVGYHQTRPEDGGHGDGGEHSLPLDHQQHQQQSRPRSSSKDYHSIRSDSQSGIGLGSIPYRTLPGEINPPVPPIAPSGGDYMSRFAPRSLSIAQNHPSSSHHLPHHQYEEDRQHQLYDETPDYSYESQIPDSVNVDDDYLLRMAKDREEILEMQRQIERLNNPQIGGHSEQSLHQDYDYDDRMLYDGTGGMGLGGSGGGGGGGMDLSTLAGSYTPIPHSSSVKYDPRHDENLHDRPPSRTAPKRSSLNSSTNKSHPTLADFTKQRQQMAHLEEQFSIPDLGELKRQEAPNYRGGAGGGSGGGGGGGGYYDDVLTPNKDLWNLSSEQEYHDEILEDENENDDHDHERLDHHEEYDSRIFSEIQAAREKEFLELFSEKLSSFSEDIAVSILDELADRLRHKLSTHLDSLGYISNPDQFDDEVVNYLQSEELQNDLENARDLMIDYVEKRSQQLRGKNHEHGHDERKSSRYDDDEEREREREDGRGSRGGHGRGPGYHHQNYPYEDDEEGEGEGEGEEEEQEGYHDELLNPDEDDIYEEERRNYGYGYGQDQEGGDDNDNDEGYD